MKQLFTFYKEITNGPFTFRRVERIAGFCNLDNSVSPRLRRIHCLHIPFTGMLSQQFKYYEPHVHVEPLEPLTETVASLRSHQTHGYGARSDA